VLCIESTEPENVIVKIGEINVEYLGVCPQEHHRHVRFGEDTKIPFQNLMSHIALFQEIAEPTNTEYSNSYDRH
jgi:hypothetical protein